MTKTARETESTDRARGRYFEGRVRTELLDNGVDRILISRIVYRSGPLTVRVPKGFKTDFASVPRALSPLFPRSGPHTPAAIVHDYLYRTTATSRVLADAVFLEAMAVLKVPRWRRVAMYLGVRAFGWIAYRAAQSKEFCR